MTHHFNFVVVELKIATIKVVRYLDVLDLGESYQILVYTQIRAQPIHGSTQQVESQPQTDIHCVGEGLWPMD